MTRYSTFRDVIDAWPTRRDFAFDVEATLAAVNKWHEKDSIRGVHFAAIVAASARRHAECDRVTAEDLVRLAGRLRDASAETTRGAA